MAGYRNRQARARAAFIAKGGATPTPTPGPTPINATTYAVTTNNDNFITKPANMTSGKGPYWPCLVDYRNFAPFPADWAVYFSTDHAADTDPGGIWLWVARGSDPKTSQWLSYDAALAAGWFDSIASKPAGNPIVGTGATNPAGFTQVETPDVNIYNGKVIMTVQANNTVNGQATLRAVSTDGLNFVLPAANNAAARLLTVPASQKVAGLVDHTGYFKSGPNPFPQLINPATGAPWAWFGGSLTSAGDQGTMGQWVTDNPETGGWSFLGPIKTVAGLESESFPEAAGLRAAWYIDPKVIRRINDTTYSALTHMTGLTSGAASGSAVIAEVFLGPLGRRHVAKSKLVLGIGSGGGIRPKGAEVFGAVLDTVNNQFVAITQWRNNSDQNVLGMITGPLRDPALTIVDRFNPDISLRTEERISFKGVSAVPAAISTYVGGTPVGVVGSAYGANGAGTVGMQSKVSFGSSKDSEFGLFYDAGEVPANYDILDMFVEDVVEDSASRASRLIFAGFATKKNVALSAQTDALYVSNTQGQTAGMLTGATGITGPGILNTLKGNVPGSSQSAAYYGFGLDVNRYLGVRGFGVRLYPKLNRAFFLGDGGSEIDEFVLPANWDWAQRLYPFLAVQTTATTTYNSFTRLGAMVIGRKAA